MTTQTLGGWLVHVMRMADGALSLEESLHTIMDSMKEYFPCQSVAVILIDEDTKELKIKISRQISYTFAKKFHRDGPGPTAEKTVLEQTPILLNSIDVNSETYKDLKLEHDYSSAILVPIVKNQRGVGYIFADRSNGEEFNEADLLHLQVIGFLVGGLISKFELIRESKKLSQIDDATGALQYRAFIPELATELLRASEHDYEVTLALLSAPDFRRYIETFGIDQAHALLADIAGTIKENIRDMDLLARFGADEFILCLSGLTEDEAGKKLNELSKAIRDGAVGQGDAEIAISIGALVLKGSKEMKKSLQEILSSLGKKLVEAKGRETDSIVIGNIE